MVCLDGGFNRGVFLAMGFNTFVTSSIQTDSCHWVFDFIYLLSTVVFPLLKFLVVEESSGYLVAVEYSAFKSIHSLKTILASSKCHWHSNLLVKPITEQ